MTAFAAASLMALYAADILKGRGIKCHPLAVAEFCDACDSEFQEGSVNKNDPVARESYSEEFLHWCMMSNIRRVERGIIG